MYGFIAFVIWGVAYGLVPRLTGVGPDPILVGIHFWLALVGYVIYVVSISIAGVLQGFAWVAGEAFIRSVINHERSSWGNHAPFVKPEDVTARRQ
jgi:cytochrome c oxidase cbb3-type subunit I